MSLFSRPHYFKHDARVVIHWRYAPCDNTTGVLSWTKPVEGVESTSITPSILIPSVCEKPPSTLLNQINSTSDMKRSHW